MLRHGATFAGHPACCAAALAAMDLYERDDVIERGRSLEGVLDAALAAVREHPLVGATRSGLGLLAGVDLDSRVLAHAPDAVGRWYGACRDAGVLVRPLGRGIAVSPPLTITEGQLRELGAALAAGLDALAADLPANVPEAPRIATRDVPGPLRRTPAGRSSPLTPANVPTPPIASTPGRSAPRRALDPLTASTTSPTTRPGPNATTPPSAAHRPMWRPRRRGSATTSSLSAVGVRPASSRSSLLISAPRTSSPPM